MRPRNLRPAEHKLACLKRITGSELTDGERFILLNCIETYLELPAADERRFQQLRKRKENRDVADIQMTWAEKVEARAIKRGLEKGMERGMERGLAAGREQGLRQGQARMLLDLLQRRFGPLTPEVQAQVETADLDILHAWAGRLLDARSLDEVLRG